MKITTIIGARPQFVKAAAISRAILNSLSHQVEPCLQEIIVHTGQHYDENMSNVFFEEMHIPAPHYNLAIGSGSHGQMTGQMLVEIETVLLSESPDW